MKKFLKLMLFIPISFFSANASTATTNIQDSKGYINSEENHTALSQEQLFNTIRKGVVTIKVNAHVILNKYSYEKMWYGTGFIVDLEKGLIATNAHVAGEIAVCSYEVKFGNGKTAEAKLEYLDPQYDFAILSVEKEKIPPYCSALKLSNQPIISNTAVYSMGNSINNEFSTYKGYVFDTESILWLKPLAEQSFQFSGLTVPGASGSPVFNTLGEVIGILYGGKFASGAALPISYITPVIDAIKNERLFKRRFFGCLVNYLSVQDAVNSDSLPDSAAEEYENAFPDSNNKLLYVAKKVSAFNEKDNPLKSGDIIWEVDGQMIGPELKKIDEIINKKDEKHIKFTVYRDGKKKEFNVPLSEFSIEKKLKLLSFAGTIFVELTDDLKINLGQINNGVFLTSSEIGSPFEEVTSPFNSQFQTSGGVYQIVELDSQKIINLDDVISIIPDLFKKKVFKIKFKIVGKDPQEYTVVTKYNPEFAEATLYQFNTEKKLWDITPIKNPTQK